MRFDIVTGAFGYTGRHIAKRLIERGGAVRTLTRDPTKPNPFGPRVTALPYRFDDPKALADSMRGAQTLFNTWWVRFEYGGHTFAEAVERNKAIFRAAREANVERIVHVSVANPAIDSPFPYFRGKALVEKALAECGVPYAIVRPTVIYGQGDILISNIAWMLRKLPVFGIVGRGDYGIQPVFVEDVADLALEMRMRSSGTVLDAAGPETFRYDELIRTIARTIGVRARIVRVPRWFALSAARLLGLAVRDVVINGPELDALRANLLVSHGKPTARTEFSEWLAANAASFGKAYASELARHFR